MVSIVMTVFNGEKHLCKSIESVLNQTYRNFEFIIVNDGSTDLTQSILQEFSATDKRIVVINNQHKGIPYSANLGIYKAKGDFVARIDHDDIWMSNKLECQIKFLESNPDVSLLGSSVIPIDIDGNVDDRFFRLFNNSKEFDSGKFRRTILRNCLICHSSSIYRKDAFDEMGGYNTTFNTSLDYELWTRFAAKYKCFIDKEPLVYYRIWQGNISETKKKIQLINSLRVRLRGLVVLGFWPRNIYYLLRFLVVVVLKAFFYWLTVKPIKRILLKKTTILQ
jgi:glycosyltransferase involved in cell wall biosynthesis